MKYLKLYQIFLFFFLLGTVFFTFSRSLNSEYAFLDDWVLLRSEQRHALKDLSVSNIINTFKYSHEGLYHPIITISYTIEKTLFGFVPAIFHFDNMLLHIANVILVFMIFFKLSNSFWLSFIVTTLFAIHPTRAEVVCWISARKDLLYAFFYLFSIFFYIKTYSSNKLKTYISLSVIMFLLACFSKAMAITLPVVLFLFDCYFNKISRERIKIYLIYVLMSLIFIFVAMKVHYSRDYIGSNFTVFIHFINFINAHFNILFYLDKLILPIKLYCMYPFFYDMCKMPPLYILYSPLLLYVLLYFSFLSLRRTKVIFYGFIFFLVTLIPASSILHIGDFVVADRYTYIPYLGLFFIFAKAIIFFYKKNKKNIRISIIISCVMIFIVLNYLSYNRTIDWENNTYEAPKEMEYYKFGIIK